MKHPCTRDFTVSTASPPDQPSSCDGDCRHITVLDRSIVCGPIDSFSNRQTGWHELASYTIRPKALKDPTMADPALDDRSLTLSYESRRYGRIWRKDLRPDLRHYRDYDGQRTIDRHVAHRHTVDKRDKQTSTRSFVLSVFFPLTCFPPPSRYTRTRRAIVNR